MKSLSIFFTGNKNAEIREVDLPAPKYDEVQVQTFMNGICMADIWKYNNQFLDIPAVQGHEGIGAVIKVGKGVKGIKEGDLITTGRWSQYLNIKEGLFIKLEKRPDEIDSYVVEPASCAVNAASYMNIYPGDSAILFGAGYMGLLLLQLLNRYPLSRLIAVDIKDYNLKLAKEFGAMETINSATDKGKIRLEELIDNPFEIVYECSGAEEPLVWCTKLAKKAGKIGIYAWHHQKRIQDIQIWHEKGLQVMNLSPSITAENRPFRSWTAADKLMSAGIIDQKRLVTHKYDFLDINKAMNESTRRPEGFIKSVLVFT